MQYDRISRMAVAVLAFGVAGLTACGPNQEVQRQIAELQSVSAEKDSLLAQVSENARLMSDIGAELAKANSPAGNAGTQEMAGPPDPELIMTHIHQLTDRLNESEAKLLDSQKRIAALNRQSKNQETRLADFDQTVSNLRATIENQKEMIVSLTDQVAVLQQENYTLAAQNEALEQTMTDMADRESTVYYAVGTKDELIQQGLITEEGGSRVLFVFGKRGKTLVPSRNIDPAALTPIDLRETTTIALPESDRDYRIVSAQDLAALASPPDEDGRVRGEIVIADPDRFWANSKVLILVRS
jgi:hypothetical protein